MRTCWEVKAGEQGEGKGRKGVDGRGRGGRRKPNLVDEGQQQHVQVGHQELGARQREPAQQQQALALLRPLLLGLPALETLERAAVGSVGRGGDGIQLADVDCKRIGRIDGLPGGDERWKKCELS
jgi:hypothetical protein